jgi:hypothetical protein
MIRTLIKSTVFTASMLVLMTGNQDMAEVHPTTNQATGKLVGAVMDLNDAVIVTPRPTIIVRNLKSKTSVEIVVGEDGQYEIRLPAGIYQISSEIGGFYPFRRAEFEIQAGSNPLINVVPALRYFVRGTTVSTKQAVDKPAPAPKYDSFSIPQSQSALLHMLIQFEKKRSSNSCIEYDTAVLSYNLLTIYTSKLSWDRKALVVKASGERVIVEDGKQRLRVRSAVVRFDHGQPILELMRRNE